MTSFWIVSQVITLSPYVVRGERTVLIHLLSIDDKVVGSTMLYQFCIAAMFALSSAQWGYSPFGGYGTPPPYPLPNSNVGVGYPTAYGLNVGRGNTNNIAPNPGSGLSSSVRCLNGGAHIGQCRLDNDAICTALGGGCVHGACCTTPFISMTTAPTVGPEVDGEVTRKPQPYTITASSTEDSFENKIDKLEMSELRRIIESSKSPTTPEPQDYVSNRHCYSGLRPVGPCLDEDDCPSLHRCEREQCCYIV